MNIQRRTLMVSILALLVQPVALSAQVPAGASGRCRDSTYTKAASREGACSRHGGIAEWFGAKVAPSRTKAADTVPAATSKAALSTLKAEPSRDVKVWTNTASNIYHCPGTRWYGVTKAGKYSKESEAKAAGARAAYGKPC